MWGHDAKMIQIGVIPEGGSPGQGKSNGSQDRRQDLRPTSECRTWSGVLMGTELWGHQLTTLGGEIGVQKGGHFGCSKSAKIRMSSMVYLHAGVEIDLPCHMLFTGS